MTVSGIVLGTRYDAARDITRVIVRDLDGYLSIHVLLGMVVLSS